MTQVVLPDGRDVAQRTQDGRVPYLWQRLALCSA